MKKMLFVMVLLLSHFGFIVYAEPQIGDLTIRFCDNQSELTKVANLEMNAEEKREVCVKVINEAYEDVEVSLSFVDWTITNDENQYKACKLEDQVENFWQFASIENPKVIVPARWSAEKRFTLQYPVWFAWKSYGCIITKMVVADWDQEVWWEAGLFDIEVRKWSFIDVTVQWSIRLGLTLLENHKPQSASLSDNTLLGIYKNRDWDYSSLITIENDWNISQELVISRTISSMFWEVHTQDLWKKMLLAWDTLTLDTPITRLPWYKWFFSTHYTIAHKPLFDFDSDAITDEMNNETVITQDSNWFIIPWLLLAIVAVLVFLTGYFFFKRRVKNWKKSSRTNKVKISNKKGQAKRSLVKKQK